MDIRTLVPRLPNRSRAFLPKLETQKEAIRQRIEEKVYIDGSEFVERTAYLEEVSGKGGKEGNKLELTGAGKDVYDSIISSKNIQLLCQDAQEIITIIRISLKALLNNFKYLQIIILCQQHFQQSLSKQKKDPRWICIPFQQIKDYPLDSISQVITINMNQPTAKSLFQLKPLKSFSVLSLSQKRSQILSNYFNVTIFKIDPKLYSEFQKKLSISNEIILMNEKFIGLRVYLALLKGVGSEKKMVVVTNLQNFNKLSVLAKYNFLEVKIKLITQFNISQYNNHFILFVEVNKPSFMKPNKDIITIKVQEEEVEDQANLSWTDMNSWTSIMSGDHSMEIAPIPFNLQQIFPNMTLKMMDFIVGGSRIRFHINHQDSLNHQDLIVMHSSDTHPSLTIPQKDSQKSMYVYRPKERFFKLITIVTTRVSEEMFNKFMSQAVKESCVTISFRECERLDCFDILKHICASPIFNDINNHLVVTFEFYQPKRFERFVLNYFLKTSEGVSKELVEDKSWDQGH